MCPQLDLESHLPIQVLLAQCSPQAPAGPHLFPGPSWLHFLHGTWVVSGFCSSSRSFPEVSVSQGMGPATASSEPMVLALRAGEMGLTPGTHVAEWPFKTCLSKLHFHPYSRLPLWLHLMLRPTQTYEGLRPKFQAPLSRTSIRHSVSIHNMIVCISLTELCGFSFFSRIFKVDKNIFCFHFLKNIRILK